MLIFVFVLVHSYSRRASNCDGSSNWTKVNRAPVRQRAAALSSLGGEGVVEGRVKRKGRGGGGKEDGG